MTTKKTQALNEVPDPFLTDVQTLRANARKQIDEGPITAAYGADLDRLLGLLNIALATEIVCVLRYKAHYYGAQGLSAEPAAAEFLQHAVEEQVHADRLADRIDQLGGTPELNPETLTSRAQTEYQTPDALMEMIKEDLVAERIVIQVDPGAQYECFRPPISRPANPATDSTAPMTTTIMPIVQITATLAMKPNDQQVDPKSDQSVLPSVACGLADSEFAAPSRDRLCRTGQRTPLAT